MSTNIIFPAAKHEALTVALVELGRERHWGLLDDGLTLQQLLHRLGLDTYELRKTTGDLVVDKLEHWAYEQLIVLKGLKALTPYLAADEEGAAPYLEFTDTDDEAPFIRWVLEDDWAAQVPVTSWVTVPDRTL